MDEQVKIAMMRWPNVPSMYGWLSLTARGQWLIHPNGQTEGLSISNQQILEFIGRNYGCDDEGLWFFQNGPQRVYVELENTPWVLQMNAQANGWQTHTHTMISSIDRILIDNEHRLYADLACGLAIIDDRDLMYITDLLHDEELDQLVTHQLQTIRIPYLTNQHAVPLKSLDDTYSLNIVRSPRAFRHHSA